MKRTLTWELAIEPPPSPLVVKWIGRRSQSPGFDLDVWVRKDQIVSGREAWAEEGWPGNIRRVLCLLFRSEILDQEKVLSWEDAVSCVRGNK